jgi:DNA invertase Pin-like site-specific DNA recombinase
MTQPERRRAAIYARISMDRTGAGLGVERQLEDGRALAADREFDVVEVFSDNDVSAYSGAKRPGYEALLDLVKRGGIDVVIAWHVDRLHRSLADLETYIEACEPTSVSTLTVRAGELDLSSASGRMMARVLGSIARHESEQKSERVRRARRQAAESGRAHGRLGYGYDDRQRIIPSEAAVVREVADRVLRGETLMSIARDLNERGVPSPGAGGWVWQQVKRAVSGLRDATELTAPQVTAVKALVDGAEVTSAQARRMVAAGWPDIDPAPLASALATGEPHSHGEAARLLTELGVPAPRTLWRAANLGKMIQRGALCGWRDYRPGTRSGGGALVAEGSWTPILDKTVTERLRAVLNAPGRKMAGRHPLYLLTGTLTCGRCGARLVGVTDTRSDRRRYQCTQVPGTARCGRLTITAPPVDQLITAAVLDVLSDSAFRSGRRRPTNAGDLDDAVEALAALDVEEAEWRTDLAAGRIDRPTFLDALDGIKERRKPLEKTVGAASPTVTAALTGIPVDRRQVEVWWEAANVEAQRRVVRALIDYVEISPAPRPGSTQFDVGRVGSPVWRA